MTHYNTMLIEPNRLFREGIKHLLSESAFRVDEEFASIEAALEHRQSTDEPELVIVDDVGGESGELQKLRSRFEKARIVVLASELSADRLKAAMTAGSDGYLMKDVSPEALIQSLQLVMIGEKVFPTNLASLLLTQMNPPTPTGSWRGLSQREREILQFLVMGASNKMIANRLEITEATVKVHLKTLLRKIDVSNRTQAAIWAMNHGITPDQAPRTNDPSRQPSRHLRAVTA